MATKKATKVIAPPIDPRENFVSLSKASSDTDAIAMEQKLHTLYQIQVTDTKIDKIYLVRGELPLEVQDLEDEIMGLKTRLSSLQAEIKEMEKAVADNKHSMEDSKRLAAKYEAQRDNAVNNREYDSLSKEIESTQLDIQIFADRVKETNKLIAEKKANVEATKAHLSGRNEDLEAKQKELESIIEETSKEEEVLLAHRAELASKVDERMLVAYDRVRKNAKNRLAVVTVKRDACGGCFNKIPPQRQLDIAQSKKIIVCEYCGRILVSSDFEKEE